MRVVKADAKKERSIPLGKRQKKSPSVQRVFSEVLETEQVESREINLALALEEVDDFARRLKESPVLENLLRYKRRVRAILLFLVEQSYDVQESSAYDLQGRRRMLVLVESIDQKLEELTRDFLNKQSSSLDLVGRLDEIRGLLLDLQI
ncbi:MAG: YaaR family protein [Limnochordia bacterium]|nr:YaaR family protein [Limnochordia bacterium]